MKTLDQIRKQYPALEIEGDTGRYLVIHCHVTATLWDSYYKARDDFRASCGCGCHKKHLIVEINSAPAMVRKAGFSVGYHDD